MKEVRIAKRDRDRGTRALGERREGITCAHGGGF